MGDNKAPFKLDKNTMCYAFCKNCIDNAEGKRQKLMDINNRYKTQQRQQQQQQHIEREQKETENNNAPNDPHIIPQRPSYFSITTLPPTSPSTLKQNNII